MPNKKVYIVPSGQSAAELIEQIKASKDVQNEPNQISKPSNQLAKAETGVETGISDKSINQTTVKAELENEIEIKTNTEIKIKE